MLPESVPAQPLQQLLAGRTIARVHVHDEELHHGGEDSWCGWIALDLDDGTQLEITSIGLHGGDSAVIVERGTRIRDLYKVVL